MVVTSYAIVWAPYYEVFLVLRFIYGVGDSGFYITAFVIGIVYTLLLLSLVFVTAYFRNFQGQ